MNESTDDAPPRAPHEEPHDEPHERQVGHDHDRSSRSRNGVGGFAEVRRPRQDRVLAGVCSGVGNRFGVDPVVIRVFVAVLCFVGLAGLILYAAAWLLLPAEDEPRSHVAEWFGLEGSEPQVREVGLLIAAVLAGVAVLTSGGWGWNGSGWFLWSVAWVVLPVGFVIWLLSRRRSDRSPTPEPQRPLGNHEHPAQSAAFAPTTGEAQGATTTTERAAASDTLVDPLATTADDRPPPGPPHQDVRSSQTPDRPRRPREPFSWIPTLLTLSAIAITTAVAYLTERPEWPTYVALALAVTGLGLIGSMFVRGGAPLILLGLALIPALVVGTVVPSWTAGDDRVEVTDIDGLQSTYSLGAGRFELDLSALDPDDLQNRTVTVDTGLGESIIRLPDELEADVEASINAGQIDVFGDRTDGLNRSVETDSEGPALRLVIDHSAGRVEVTR